LDSALDTINDLLNNQSNNLTDSEKTALGQGKANVQDALTIIQNTQAAIADANDKTAGITTDNVKSSDKTNLDSALATIKDLLDNKTGNLTDSEKSALGQKKTDVENVVEKIQTNTAAITDIGNSIANITIDNVQKDDLTELENAVDKFGKILTDYNDNLSDDEKNQISDKIESIQNIIDLLEEVKVVEDLITALPDANNVTKEHGNDIDNATKGYDELTDYQKTLVNPDLKTKLIDVTKALTSLLLEDSKTGTKVEGMDGTVFDIKTELVVTPINDTLDVKTKALFAAGVSNVATGQEIAQLYNIQLLLNGQPIQPNGKVKVTLKLTEEMKTYTNLQVVYITDDGNVTIIPFERNGDEVSFITEHFSNYGIIGTPVKSDDGNQTNTGDTTPVIPYAIIGAISLLIVFAVNKKRKYKVVAKK